MVASLLSFVAAAVCFFSAALFSFVAADGFAAGAMLAGSLFWVIYGARKAREA